MLRDDAAERFLVAVHTQKPVGGLTPNYYRYPARFSPLFARAVIEAFSRPSDAICDPFMGGATSLVEARALGRHSVGSDISSQSAFVAQTKTTTLPEPDLEEVMAWVDSLEGRLNLHQPAENVPEPEQPHYQRHVPWAIRKTIGLILTSAIRRAARGTRPTSGTVGCVAGPLANSLRPWA